MTIGMVAVAFCAALVGGTPHVAMTSTLIWASSTAMAAMRSVLPAANRHSIARFFPST